MAVFTCARFSLTANVSHGTLYLVLSFVGIHFAAASRCALTKFSYSSFAIPSSVFSCSISNLFLNSTTYLSLKSLLLRRAQSYYLVVAVRVAFFRRLSRIFAVTIRWSEDTVVYYYTPISDISCWASNLFLEYQKQLPWMTNMRTSSMPVNASSIEAAAVPTLTTHLKNQTN